MDELRVEGVRVEYGDLVAVRDVDLVVHPGQLISVTGPSGAGKSSLLWAIAGLSALVLLLPPLPRVTPRSCTTSCCCC